jgi:hypothetical protein
MKSYFLDQIKEVIVRSALSHLQDHVKNNLAC